MKDEIEKILKMVLGTKPRCRATSSPNRSRVCAFHNLSHGFYRVMCYVSIFIFS